MEKNEQTSYLTFKLGDETFAANVSKVLNIVEIPKITKLPRAPKYMLGAINHQGNALPVIDTKVKLSLKESARTMNTCILVLDVIINLEHVQVGAMVDSVQEVLEIEKEQILPSPNKSEFVSGMYKVNDENFIMILDMDKVLSY